MIPQGKLDFASYPERLMITDIVPNMISGVLFAQCIKVYMKVQIVTIIHHFMGISSCAIILLIVYCYRS